MGQKGSSSTSSSTDDAEDQAPKPGRVLELDTKRYPGLRVDHELNIKGVKHAQLWQSLGFAFAFGVPSDGLTGRSLGEIIGIGSGAQVESNGGKTKRTTTLMHPPSPGVASLSHDGGADLVHLLANKVGFRTFTLQLTHQSRNRNNSASSRSSESTSSESLKPHTAVSMGQGTTRDTTDSDQDRTLKSALVDGDRAEGSETKGFTYVVMHQEEEDGKGGGACCSLPNSLIWFIPLQMAAAEKKLTVSNKSGAVTAATLHSCPKCGRYSADGQKFGSQKVAVWEVAKKGQFILHKVVTSTCYTCNVRTNLHQQQQQTTRENGVVNLVKLPDTTAAHEEKGIDGGSGRHFLTTSTSEGINSAEYQLPEAIIRKRGRSAQLGQSGNSTNSSTHATTTGRVDLEAEEEMEFTGGAPSASFLAASGNLDHPLSSMDEDRSHDYEEEPHSPHALPRSPQRGAEKAATENPVPELKLKISTMGNSLRLSSSLLAPCPSVEVTGPSEETPLRGKRSPQLIKIRKPILMSPNDSLLVDPRGESPIIPSPASLQTRGHHQRHLSVDSTQSVGNQSYHSVVTPRGSLVEGLGSGVSPSDDHLGDDSRFMIRTPKASILHSAVNKQNNSSFRSPKSLVIVEPQNCGQQDPDTAVVPITPSKATAAPTRSALKKNAPPASGTFVPEIMPAGAVSRTSVANKRTGGRMNAVLVQSDQAAYEKMNKMLEQCGIRVTGFRDPSKALAFLSANTAEAQGIGLLVTDLVLLGTSGTDFLQQVQRCLKKQGLGDAVPILATAGSPMFSEVALSCGASAFVARSASSVEVKRAVYSLMTSRR